MKKIFIIILMISCISFGQRKTGSLASPFATSGWDVPASYSPYYGFAYYTLLSNPGGWININLRMTDSLFNKLIVYTDSLQMVVKDDTLHFSDTLSYAGAFATTDTVDTVSVQGVDSLDIVMISARETNPQSYLWAKVINNAIIANRSSGTVSGLKYNWIWIRKYQ